jgi:XRE family transcriptional regulator, regulator of sulfur utilization
MNLGEIIKSQRKKQGINQNDFAESCSISQAYLSLIENNQKEPNLSTLKDIAQALQIPLPILFFMSLEDNDIQENKREAFKFINKPIKSMVNEFFTNNNQKDGNQDD